MQPTNPTPVSAPPSLPNNAGDSVSPPKEPKKLTARDGCFGCLGLVICALFAMMLLDKCTGEKALDTSPEGQITSHANRAFKGIEQLEITPQVDGGVAVHVRWKKGTSWSAGTSREAIFMNIHSFLSGLSKTGGGSDVVRYWFDPQIEVIDQYGKESVVPGAKVIIPREAFNRIQWNNFDWKMLMNLAESEGMVTWHPAMLKE